MEALLALLLFATLGSVGWFFVKCFFHIALWCATRLIGIGIIVLLIASCGAMCGH